MSLVHVLVLEDQVLVPVFALSVLVLESLVLVLEPRVLVNTPDLI